MLGDNQQPGNRRTTHISCHQSEKGCQRTAVARLKQFAHQRLVSALCMQFVQHADQRIVLIRLTGRRAKRLLSPSWIFENLDLVLSWLRRPLLRALWATLAGSPAH